MLPDRPKPDRRTPPRFGSIPPYRGGDPTIRVYQLPRPAIQYLSALVEAGDGIGLVRTLDEGRGLIECWIMPDYAEDFERLMAATTQHWPIQHVGTRFE